MTLREVGELGHSHVEHNDHQHAKKSLHFQERIGYPGPDLIKQFMKRKNLHAKQATTLNSMQQIICLLFFISMIYWKKQLRN